MKRWKKLVSWLLLACGVAFLLSFVLREQSRIVCRDIHVTVNGDTPWSFVTVGDVRDRVKPLLDTLMDKPLSQWDVQDVEARVNKIPAVWSAQVYSSIGGQLRIDVTQRRPIARLIARDGSQAYLDSTGVLMPVNPKWIARLPVINGYIKEKLTPGKYVGSRGTTSDSHILYGAYKIADYVHSSRFWRAQVQQVYVNENKSFQCIPRVGKHTIVLGGASELEQKFKKLDLLYKKGFKPEDWNRYSKIDLSYKDQIVCTLK